MNAVEPGARVRRGVSLRGLRWRWSYNRHVLTIALLISAAVVGWRMFDPPTHIIERSAPVAVLDVGEQQLARDYAAQFLTFDAKHPDARTEALSALTGMDAQAIDGGLAAESGSRRVLSTAIVQAQPAPSQLGTRYVVAVDSDTDARSYLAVTVGRDSNGAVRLVGTPALVGAPLSVSATPDPAGRDVQDPGVRTVTERALGNYLDGNAGDLAADLAPTAIVSPPTVPLHLQRVSAVRTERGVPAGVLVTADVLGPQGEQMQLTYELGVQQLGGRWVVSGIQVNPAGP